MLTTTIQPRRTQGLGARRGAARVLVCAAALTSVTLLTVGPAQARIENPLDTGGRAGPDADAGMSEVASGKVTSTRITGLYGVKVGGGWLLR